jgi:hypothetical protein
LTLAGANPAIFPDVAIAPFMKRTIVPRPNVIDGNPQPIGQVTSYDAAGTPYAFYYSYLFGGAVLAD